MSDEEARFRIRELLEKHFYSSPEYLTIVSDVLREYIQERKSYIEERTNIVNSYVMYYSFIGDHSMKRFKEYPGEVKILCFRCMNSGTKDKFDFIGRDGGVRAYRCRMCGPQSRLSFVKDRTIELPNMRRFGEE